MAVGLIMATVAAAITAHKVIISREQQAMLLEALATILERIHQSPFRRPNAFQLAALRDLGRLLTDVNSALAVFQAIRSLKDSKGVVAAFLHQAEVYLCSIDPSSLIERCRLWLDSHQDIVSESRRCLANNPGAIQSADDNHAQRLAVLHDEQFRQVEDRFAFLSDALAELCV